MHKKYTYEGAKLAVDLMHFNNLFHVPNKRHVRHVKRSFQAQPEVHLTRYVDSQSVVNCSKIYIANMTWCVLFRTTLIPTQCARYYACKVRRCSYVLHSRTEIVSKVATAYGFCSTFSDVVSLALNDVYLFNTLFFMGLMMTLNGNKSIILCIISEF